MAKTIALALWGLFCLSVMQSSAQKPCPVSESDTIVSEKLLRKLQMKTIATSNELTLHSKRYLVKMRLREAKMYRLLSRVDSTAAKELFAGSSSVYEQMTRKIQANAGFEGQQLTGTYKPYLDSLQGIMKYLGDASAVQALQAKMADADQVQSFFQTRKQVISGFLIRRPDLQPALGKQLNGLNGDAYYYSQQLREYREMWDHPEKLEQKALAILNKLPAFQEFMKNNSQLSSLFRLPKNYGSEAALTGLQTRSQVANQVQNQVAAGGEAGQGALQSNLESAQSQLDGYKDKLSKMGAGNGEMDVPDFKPNDQRTKPFWNRLEYGTNFQTTHTNYYFPTVTDFGFSLGYRLGHSNVVGIGASYKVGWGNGIRHIAFSSQGAGLRSFLELKVKNSWSATGGFEMNYTTPFTSFQDIKRIERWTQSGLLGVSKAVSMRTRFFKQTKLQLLWDFLSYEQVPKTQPILFRVGYTF